MSPNDTVEILFAHAYFVAIDRDRPGLMQPLAPLRPAEVAAWVQQQAGGTVGLWDATFRLDPSSFEVEVSRSRPRIVWIYCHPATRQVALQMVGVGRRSGAVVLVAGPDAGLQPRMYLEAGAHAALQDDGAEGTTLTLLLALRAGCYRPDEELLARAPGIHYRSEEGSLVRTQGRVDVGFDVEMPRPLRDPTQTRIQLEHWRNHRGYRALAIRSARGCPCVCGFCSRSVFDRPYLRREPLDVVQEMVELADRFEVDRFVFVDEVFLFDAVWLRDFAAALDVEGPGIPFEVQAHPSVLGPDMLSSLAEVGLVHVDLDAASGSSALLERLCWTHRPSDVYRAADWIRKAGATLGLQVLVGLPTETSLDLDASLEMVRLVRPDAVEVGRVDPGSRALLQKDWERVVAPGPSAVSRRTSRLAGAPSRVARDAAVAWMRSIVPGYVPGPGRVGGGDDFVARWLGKWRRPLLRSVVRAVGAGSGYGTAPPAGLGLLRSGAASAGDGIALPADAGEEHNG